MYYNSNKSRSNYYNTYKEEMADLEDYNDEFSFQKVMKIGFIILTLGILSILSIYLANYFSTTKKESIPTQIVQQKRLEKIPKVLSSEHILPKSIQFQESRDNSIANKNKAIAKTEEISPKEIALIVEIILAQMNHKEEITLEKQLLDSEKNRITTKTLKESNHYNKVIVSNLQHKKNTNQQIELREDLNRALSSSEKISSIYERAITKEIDVRSNEMRIIIVQRGDTLSKIAKKAYGDIDAYPKIFIANPEILKNPDEIFAGQRLRIPA